ncbi:MAG TPA: hypothetical protein VKT53_15455 [Candidatus Acidoferrum sp.]|nr:hypothetical protein [Candidatus Acidoferrum sp.]
MLKALIFPTLLVAACCALEYSGSAQTNQVAKPPARVKPTRPELELAKWSAEWETSLGISRDKFAAMGLSKLTVKEAGEMVFWASTRETSAEQKGMEKQKSIQFHHDCGRTAEDQAAANKVNLFISEGETGNSEVLSGLRQRLRAIPDIQIVYAEKESDLTLSVIGAEDRLTNDRKVGYNLAVALMEPCRDWFGSDESQAFSSGKYEALFYFSGADLGEVIEPAVAKIDAKYIEDCRKSHASWKEALSKIKK